MINHYAGSLAAVSEIMPLLSRLLKEIRLLRRSAEPPPAISPERVRMLVESGQGRQAETLLRQRLERDPGDADAWHLLGLCSQLQGNFGEAARRIEKALEHRPDIAFLHSNLAEAYVGLSRLDMAERHYQRALLLSPGSPVLLLGLARINEKLGRAQQALVLARQASAIDPGSCEACGFESTMLAATGSPPQAIARITGFLDGGRLHPGLEIQRYLLQSEICDWKQDRSRAAAIVREWAEAPQDPAYAGIHPFLAWHLDLSDRLRLACTQAYVDRLVNDAGGAARAPDFSSCRHSSARLSLGYLSADFHNHPTMHLMKGMFRLHDRGRFHVTAFSFGPDDGSEYRANAVSGVDRFIDLSTATPTEAAQRIRDERIDVLVDLKGLTLNARPSILARRPAPVQITWLGYPATTGSGLADYALVDRTVAPEPGAFGEKLIWMPRCYQVNDQGQEIGLTVPERSALGLPRESLVYACFNQAYKIDPVMFDVWMRILGRVSDSVLWLYRSNVWSEANLRREAAARGIDPARLVFADPLPKAQHLARLKLADLALDTRLINAHTGASDALWAGVPLLTHPGSGFPSRVAASVLAGAGLNALVCPTLDSYEELAVRLGRNRGDLADLRNGSLKTPAQLPLFDTEGFVRSLERAIELAWDRFVRGLAPDHITVPAIPPPC